MDVKAERVNPYRGDTRCKTEQVRDMFDSIAPAYDFMNRMMTLGIDKLWRRKAVRMLSRMPHADILDVATGTGDLALLLARSLRPDTVTGIDLSDGMLEVARRKAVEAQPQGHTRLDFLRADCLDLPMAEGSFDIVTAAYGVRNFEHLLEGYREMYRVLRPGGTLCVIELSTPTSPLVKPFYKFYTRHVIPLAGRLVSRDVRAYSYLPESIAAVPQGDAMLSLMREAGFTSASFRPLTFGVCTIYLARK
ncbi:bifunctional demethylmenaquinone methyltransferase/2-methoxy-6-polyprenyl-1,4-benzoquinol methylase UbiE [uncultured Muribaculum sp.]|uniref:bifunctional demethylmenaquinone methyltransferase/2-methoxy-6-polyprenyl-1,4-benzoquinol methylase UbiE n=1 Tax=uncultured Muribaculum sp. TaxID=1918613 RepID=UPI0025E24ECC|nr:bifunctional demethylmenaquinone methyltransferase/2-methoxy-6-polyprenyl-1,4-benzoquinol methylase UbiE [uncultured Muribaculum sp.]